MFMVVLEIYHSIEKQFTSAGRFICTSAHRLNVVNFETIT